VISRCFLKRFFKGLSNIFNNFVQYNVPGIAIIVSFVPGIVSSASPIFVYVFINETGS
jgi:hypothetical protein